MVNCKNGPFVFLVCVWAVGAFVCVLGLIVLISHKVNINVLQSYLRWVLMRMHVSFGAANSAVRIKFIMGCFTLSH